MKTPDQLENESAWRLRHASIEEAIKNCNHHEDWDAAAVAILSRAIELITKKEVEICYKK
jgi:hypothetical protein